MTTIPAKLHDRTVRFVLEEMVSLDAPCFITGAERRLSISTPAESAAFVAVRDLAERVERGLVEVHRLGWAYAEDRIPARFAERFAELYGSTGNSSDLTARKVAAAAMVPELTVADALELDGLLARA